MRLLAPAKINLHLRVGSVEPSGFHPLASWFCTVALFDTLTIDPLPAADTDGEISLTCDTPGIPTDEANLVVRAAIAMQQLAAKHPRDGLRIHLQKRIPSGGGLGGGSSDAARTLLALKRLWHIDVEPDKLTRIAATLGSDVPFFLHGPSNVCTGRGEIVRPIAPPAARSALLFFPQIALSTAQVYRTFDQMQLGRDSDLKACADLQSWTALAAGELLPRLVNDLEAPAFAICPELRELRDALERELGRVIRMSGSGSTLFTLFDTLSEARSAQRVVQDEMKVAFQAVELAPKFVDDLPAPI